MSLSELKLKFENFVEDISFTHSTLKEIIRTTEDIFYSYSMAGIKSKTLEGNLFYLENLNISLQEFLDNCNSITYKDETAETDSPNYESNEKYKITPKHNLTKDNKDDIYVNLNNPMPYIFNKDKD